MKQFSLTLTAVALAVSSQAFAWGERGHHAICEVATRLVQNNTLKAFLQSRGDMMGHVCNIPDIYWRDMGPVAKPGDAAHFINPEHGGYTPETMPTDFSAIVAAAGRPAAQVADDLGSSWWRADQFYRLGVENGKTAKKSPFPDHAHEQDRNFPFNKAVNGMITSMGLMGHFVGDASQPFHNTADYDGYASGHGGIHSYYETTSINAMSFELVAEVEKAARALRPSRDFDVSEGTVVERMKALSVTAFHDQKRVEDADQVQAPSQTQPHKVPAKRGNGAQGAKQFHNLIIPELARSAVLLAKFWDEIYAQAGYPDVFKYRTYNYPLAPDFVGLDYAK